MGLEGLELVMGFEDAFGIDIPDAIAAKLSTPRMVVDYVARTLPAARGARCLTQQTFHRLRRALRSVLPGSEIRGPETSLLALATPGSWPALWPRVRGRAGAVHWPASIAWRPWLADGPPTLGELARHIAAHHPAPRPDRGEPWTRDRIDITVRHVIWDTVFKRGFSLDAHFIHDLKISA